MYYESSIQLLLHNCANDGMRDPPNAKNIYKFHEVKNLELMGVQEMNAKEMQNTEGGLGFLISLGLFAIGAGIGFFGRDRGWW